MFGKTPLVVGAGIKTGLHILIDDPGCIAGDLVAMAVAAKEHYSLPCVIIDVGTAKKIVTKSFENVAFSSSDIKLIKDEVSAIVNNFKSNNSSGYDFNVETGVDYQKDKPGVTLLKQMYQDIENIYNKTFNENINQYVRSFNDSCGDVCSSLRDCFGIKTYTSKENNGIIEPYNPSSGEKCMLLLHNVLVNDNKNVYILDEPELSVGHKYINEIIVPRLKELAALDKIIIVSTHDANIAVRTLPLMTIYREYKKTYVGNLFIDELLEINNADRIKWTDTSMTYLEGGDFAFKERGNSYGI